MPLKPHPTDPDKMVYFSHHYDIPQLQGITTTPQHEWVGLTDVDAVELWQLARHDIVEFARIIEAKLKEKNT